MAKKRKKRKKGRRKKKKRTTTEWSKAKRTSYKRAKRELINKYNRMP